MQQMENGNQPADRHYGVVLQRLRYFAERVTPVVLYILTSFFNWYAEGALWTIADTVDKSPSGLSSLSDPQTLSNVFLLRHLVSLVEANPVVGAPLLGVFLLFLLSTWLTYCILRNKWKAQPIEVSGKPMNEYDSDEQDEELGDDDLRTKFQRLYEELDRFGHRLDELEGDSQEQRAMLQHASSALQRITDMLQGMNVASDIDPLRQDL